MTMMLIPNILITLLFNYSNHPMSMTIIIIMQTLILSIHMSLITKTFWMSYILFLVFLGGMLVLFLYITSLASNEIFSTNQPKSLMITSSLIIMMVMLAMSYVDQLSWNIFMSNTDSYPLTYKSNLLTSHTNQCSSLIKLHNTYTSITTFILINYLFMTLIAIVKITNIHMGPLRSTPIK
nr:NADH dehydrogenase subunit 6 [Chloracris brunneri]